MPAVEKEYDVLAYFHAKDPRTGSTVFHHPDGDVGWPTAKKTFKGDPGSDQVRELLALGLISEKKSTPSNKEN